MKRLGCAMGVLALIAVGCSDEPGSSSCDPGTFELVPAGGAARTVTKDVCYHGMQEIGDCGVYNYRLGGSADFSEYLDIFWGGRCSAPNIDGAFMDGGQNYQLSGTPTGVPRETSTPSGQDLALLASGTYTAGTETGTFQLKW